jgi:putative endonuclease
MKEAIARETRLKGWRRGWKLQLIEADNPEWRDLSDGWYDETTNLWLLNPNSP